MKNFTEQNREATKQDLNELANRIQKSTESAMQKSTESTIQKAIESTIQKATESMIQKAIESMIQKSIDPIVQRSTKRFERSKESESEVDKGLVALKIMTGLALIVAVFMMGIAVFTTAKKIGLI